MTALDFDHVVEQYHLALVEFAKGNPKPVNALLSHRDDVSLAGGFGGVTRGWEEVAKNVEFAASNFEGQITFKNLAKYATQDLGYIVEIERYKTKVGEGEEMARVALRVTSIFRREDGIWKLVHRQGDPFAALLALARALPETVISIQKADWGERKQA